MSPDLLLGRHVEVCSLSSKEEDGLSRRCRPGSTIAYNMDRGVFGLPRADNYT